jgi:pteridine reductase
MSNPVALITGAAKRVGAAIVETLHQQGYKVYLHYRSASQEASELAAKLNARRADSVVTMQADLADLAALQQIANQLSQHEGKLDLLVNNASAFYPTAIGATDEQQWNDLMASNMKGPFFLSQACTPLLTQAQGSIVNLVDTNAIRPMAGYSVYCMAKAGLVMMTRSLAVELAPKVRVNAIAPGAILWPNQEGAEMSSEAQQAMLAAIPLQRTGEPQDIAQTVLFLAHASYITGQVLAVDGGRVL